MSQTKVVQQHIIKTVIAILGFVLLGAWFYFDRDFEPLIGILVASEAFLLWSANRNSKFIIPAIVIPIAIFFVGVIMISQQKNAQPDSPPSSAINEDIVSPNKASSSPEKTPLPPTPTSLLFTDTPTSLPPTDTPIPPIPTDKPTPQSVTPTTFVPIIRVSSNGSLSSLMPNIDDVPSDMKLYEKKAFSEKEIALGNEFPADFYLQLSEWGSKGGYHEVYDTSNICSTSLPYQVVVIQVYLLEDEIGAKKLYEWMYNDFKEKTQTYSGSFWDFQESNIGDRGFEHKGDILFCLDGESSLYHRIIFQRYNMIVKVELAGFDSKAEQYSFESWTKSLSNIVDVNIVAEANK